MPLQNLIKLKADKIDYNSIINHNATIIEFDDKTKADVNIFIPIKGRHQHLKTTIHY